jgi:hypothetical protein
MEKFKNILRTYLEMKYQHKKHQRVSSGSVAAAVGSKPDRGALLD